MNIHDRRSNIDVTVMLIVVTVAVTLQRIIPDVENSLLFVLVSVVTARGVYELLIQAIYWAIRGNDRLLRLFWGRLYIAGMWEYGYVLKGVRYRGVWQIDQDDRSTRVKGFGLGDDLETRTVVRSVSPLIEEQGAYFILNDRIEFEPGAPTAVPVDAATAADPKFNASEPTYSKTTLFLDGRRAPRVMRGFTHIFGGPTTGQIHTTVVFRKLDCCDSIPDAIEKLAAERNGDQVIRRIEQPEVAAQQRSA
jgi:hypothetical protein